MVCARMRLAFLHRRLGREGGTEADLYRTVSGLAERGHDVHLFCADVRAPAPPGVNVHRLRVVRAGAVEEVPAAQLVRDDLIELRAGDQVPADGIVVRSDALEVDESLLTGESDAIVKHEGDGVLSGSEIGRAHV